MKLVVRIAQQRSGRYRAWCPALPGCEVTADTREEAGRRIDLAVRSYLASLNVAMPARPITCVQPPALVG
ncbi:MAG: type II toxin-antitoxin system HicB family antitoxin [Phycisphaerae bacterium]